MKKRHRLSISCINDIISLLRTLHVQNVPSSWYNLKRNLITAYTPPIQTFICPYCQQTSTNSVTCSQCSNHFNGAIKPSSFLSFSIRNQIERILHYNRDVVSTLRSPAISMKDICDGAVHRTIQNEIQEPFLTLTLNVDGIQPRKGSQVSIWSILIVINEIPLKKRFAIENVILAGVWPGPNKPSRADMSLFFRPLVDELLTLEHGTRFSLYADDDDISVTARVFLIGACCDKPAQSLLQFLPEPTAEYGCGRCEVPGILFHL